MFILVRQFRGQHVENVYSGSIAIVDSTGKLLYQAGDSQRPVFMRSTIKPLFAWMLAKGETHQAYKLTEAEIAVVAGSHMGERTHVEVVRSLLAKAGLTEENLNCGIHLPFSLRTVSEIINSGQAWTPLHHNCSGFHAGLLLVTRSCGADIHSYCQKGHVVQQRLLDLLISMVALPADRVLSGIDDCNVPTYAIPLTKIAYLYAQLGCLRTTDSALSILWQAILSNPTMLAGADTLETDLIGQGYDVLGKIGGNGCYCISVPRMGIGIAIKVDSGNYQASECAAMQVLLDLGVVSREHSHLVSRYYRQVGSDSEGNERTHFASHFTVLF